MGRSALTRRAVFFDRDGVLNLALVRDGKPIAPSRLDELTVAPEAPQCLARLRDAGFLLIVATNQPDLARGRTSKETLEQIHAVLRAAMPLDAIYVCAHDNADRCACRKPEPGMLLDAARDFGIDLGRSFMIGDRWRDVDAGARAGCRTVLLDFDYREPAPEHAPDARVRSLRDAVDWILERAG